MLLILATILLILASVLLVIFNNLIFKKIMFYQILARIYLSATILLIFAFRLFSI